MATTAIAETVAASITDELRTTRLTTAWSVVGIVALHVAAVLPNRRHLTPIESDAVFVVHNPVAHGAIFVEQVVEALSGQGLHCSIIADTRLREFDAQDVIHFPSLGIRSLVSWVRPTLLPRAWRIARIARGLVTVRSRAAVGTYLTLAQTVRFLLVREAIMRQLQRWPSFFTDFDRGVYSTPFVDALRSMGQACATLVHGSPSSTYLPVLASDVYVWGEVQEAYFRDAGVTGITQVGRPDWTKRPVDTGPIRRLVLCHSMETLSVVEQQRLQTLIRWAKDAGCPSLVRWHPRSKGLAVPKDWTAVLGTHVEEASESELRDLLGPGDLVAVVASTAGVDALMLGRRVVVLADDARDLPCDLAAIRAVSPLPGAETKDPHMSDAVTVRLTRVQTKILRFEGRESAHQLAHAILSLR